MVLSYWALTHYCIDGPFSDYVYGGSKGLEEFSTPLNYNQIIMYTATFTTYAVNYLVCPYTLERNTIGDLLLVYYS
jgi:hypothetical protein